MRKPLSSRNISILRAGTPTGLLLAVLLVFSSCGGPAAPPGVKPPGMGPPGAAKKAVSKPVGKAKKQPVAAVPGLLPGRPITPPPAAKQPVEPSATPASSATVSHAGNQVDLAVAILTAGTNPFFSRLPRPSLDMPVIPGGEPGDQPPPVDPFANINLLGIIYNPKMPMALVALSGGQAQSQMVRLGDVLMVDGGQMKVASISHDTLELKQLGGSQESRSFILPNIVGYGSTNPSGGGNPGLEILDPGSANPDELGNLKKLSSQNPLDIVLQEP